MRRPTPKLSQALISAALGLACFMPTGALSLDEPSQSQVDRSEIIRLNNDGVKCLNKGDFPGAVEKFEQAIKLDPLYEIAQDNLAIACNNWGLKLRSNPKAALYQFHKAFYLNPQNPTTLQNVEGIIRLMGKDPGSFRDRVQLGDEARAAVDYRGAVIEYGAALRLHEDASVRELLENAQYNLRPPNPPRSEDTSPADDTQAKVPTLQLTPAEAKDVDFGPYMRDLQWRIKRNWFPPKGNETKRVVAACRCRQRKMLPSLI